MDKPELFSHFASILQVEDVAKTIQFYQASLGFTLHFAHEDPPTYAVLKRGEGVQIHLTQGQKPVSNQPLSIYIFVHDIEQVYAEYQEKDILIIEKLNQAEYGMKEFQIEDINGYRIAIGQGIN